MPPPRTESICVPRHQVRFCLKWINETWDVTTPLRRRRTAGMHLETSGLVAQDLLQASSRGEQGRRPIHELVDMRHVAKAEQASTGSAGRVRARTSTCGFPGCPMPIGAQKRAPFKCFQCRDGKGAYYHVACFFKCHKCYA